MKTLKLTLLFIFFAIPMKGMAIDAEHTVGNGGDLVVCRDESGGIKSVELLDLYEGRVERGIEPQVNRSTSKELMLEEFTRRLNHFDSYLADLSQEYIGSFFNEANLIAGIELVDIPDSDHISFPKSCKVEQVAIQKNKIEFPGDKRYVISKDLWDKMDSLSQAGLILHEVLYRIKIENSRKPELENLNSISVRYFTSLIIADRLGDFDFKSYLRFLSHNLGVRYTNIDSIQVPIRSVFFYKSGKVKRYSTETKSSYKLKINEDESIELAKGSLITREFFKNGSSESLKVERIGKPGVVSFNGQTFNYVNRLVLKWSGKGQVVHFESDAPLRAHSYYQNKEQGHFKCFKIEFYHESSGEFTCFSYLNPTFEDLSRERSSKEAVFEIHFNNQRRIISTELLGRDELTHTFHFFKNGAVSEIECHGKNALSYRNGSSEGVLRCGNENESITFYDNANVKEFGYLMLEWPFEGFERKKRIRFDCENVGKTEYQAYENGQPKWGRIPTKSDIVVFLNESKVRVNKNDRIYFDKEGKIVKVEVEGCPLFYSRF